MQMRKVSLIDLSDLPLTKSRRCGRLGGLSVVQNQLQLEQQEVPRPAALEGGRKLERRQNLLLRLRVLLHLQDVGLDGLLLPLVDQLRLLLLHNNQLVQSSLCNRHDELNLKHYLRSQL